MNQQRYRLAIDFGTSNTAAAVENAEGRIHVLRLSTRSDTMPSAVTLYDARLVVGEEALRLAGLDPTAFEPAPKRRLGEPYVGLAGELVHPVDLVAAVLGQVYRTAIQQADGTVPSSVILSHPEAWGEHLLGRLRDAAGRAGIDPRTISLVSEPVSAGWHYAANAHLTPGDRIAVVDFGGGTCDAAVLDYAGRADAGFTVVRVGGLDPLGGNDFDDLLYRWVIDQLRKDGRQDMVEALSSPSGLGSRLTLREQVREAKHALSMLPRAPIPVSVAGQQEVCTVTRDEFDALLAPLLGRAVAMVADVLGLQQTSGQLPAGLKQLFLTGGSSLIPGVQREFQRLTGGRVGTLGDPKQITCVGALQAPEPTMENRVSPPPPDGEALVPRPRRNLTPALLALVGVIFVALVAWAVIPGTRGGVGDTPKVSPSVTYADPPLDSPSPAIPSPSIPSPSTRSPSTPSPSTPSPSTPSPSTESSCPASASKGECRTLTALPGSFIQRDTCRSSKDRPDLYSMVCDPAEAEKITGAVEAYLFRFPKSADLDSAVDNLLTAKGFTADKVSTDAAKPPMKSRWHYGDSGPAKGTVMLWEKDGSAVLVWTYDEQKIWVSVEAANGKAANLYSWWLNT